MKLDSNHFLCVSALSLDVPGAAWRSRLQEHLHGFTCSSDRFWLGFREKNMTFVNINTQQAGSSLCLMKYSTKVSYSERYISRN